MKEKELRKRIKARRREDAKKEGYFDGRFSPRVEEDKTKTKYLKLRRTKIKLNESRY